MINNSTHRPHTYLFKIISFIGLYHVYLLRDNAMIRKTLLPFIALMLIFIKPSFAQNPPPGGWKWDNARVTVEKDMQRIRLGVEAQKTYPVAIVDPKTNKITQNVLKAQKSAIKITPTANKVGKTLLKRNPYGAITQAVTALLGKAVDWVLDPENNRIKYKDDADGGSWTSQLCYYSTKTSSYYSTAEQMGNAACAATGNGTLDRWAAGVLSPTNKSSSPICTGNPPDYRFTAGGGGMYSCTDNPEPEPEPVQKYIPIDTVAQQVIANADAGHAPSMEVMSDTALDMLEAGELDSALDAAAEPKQYGENEYPPDAVPNPKPDTGTDPETPTDPENPNPNPNPEPTPWPAFCDWATKMCDLADWIMDDEPLPEDTQIPEQDIELRDPESFDQSYITAPNQCPPDVEKNIPIGSNSFNFVIPMTPVCDFGANVISPVLYFIALLQAAFIIGSAFKVG